MSEILTIDETKTKANIILDASKIDLFETCPRRYQIRYLLKRSLPLHAKPKALDMGGIAHSGFEVYYKGLAEGVHFSDRIDAVILRMNSIISDPKESNLDTDESQNLVKSVVENCDYWRSEDENCLEILAVESPFAYVLYEDDYVRIIISGKIDLLANYKAIGSRGFSYTNMPFDHKTFSRDSMVLRKSNQFTNYASAVDSSYLMVNRVGLTKTKPEDRFKRLILTYDPLYVKDWKDNLTQLILNEYLTCISENHWPEKSTSCNKFNRLCEYYQICDSSGIEAKESKLNNEYVEAPEWDVTGSLKE